MKNILKLLLIFFILGCSHEFPKQSNRTYEDSIEQNFDIQFHDWYTRTDSITIHPLTGTQLIQILAYTMDSEESTSLKVLSSCIGDKAVTLNYDIPSSYINLYVACVMKEGYYMLKKFELGDREVNFKRESKKLKLPLILTSPPQFQPSYLLAPLIFPKSMETRKI